MSVLVPGAGRRLDLDMVSGVVFPAKYSFCPSPTVSDSYAYQVASELAAQYPGLTQYGELHKSCQYFWQDFNLHCSRAQNKGLSLCKYNLSFENTNVKLDGMKIQPTGGSDNYIVRLEGNNVAYEQKISEMMQDAENLKCNIIGYNPPGVGFSTGEVNSKNDLVSAGIAQVQNLLNNGVAASKIILKGQSMGGGCAAEVARHFHALNPPQRIGVFVDRSFTNLPDLATEQWHQKKDLVKINWNMDVVGAFQQIPDDFKDYIYSPSDRVVPLELSTVSGLPVTRNMTTVDPHEMVNTDSYDKKDLHVSDPEKMYVMNENGTCSSAQERFESFCSKLWGPGPVVSPEKKMERINGKIQALEDIRNSLFAKFNRPGFYQDQKQNLLGKLQGLKQKINDYRGQGHWEPDDIRKEYNSCAIKFNALNREKYRLDNCPRYIAKLHEELRQVNLNSFMPIAQSPPQVVRWAQPPGQSQQFQAVPQSSSVRPGVPSDSIRPGSNR